MRTSFVIAAMVVTGAGATGAGAVHFGTSPFNGSDAEYNLINMALQSSGLGTSGDFAGGGSGAGENAMTASTPPTQWTAPMGKMLTNASCSTTSRTYPVSGAAPEQSHASGLVFALGALDMLASTSSGASAGCNTHSSDGTDTTHGVAATTTLTYTGGAVTFRNWTDVLALLYGGLDKSQATKSRTATARSARPSSPTGTTCFRPAPRRARMRPPARRPSTRPALRAARARRISPSRSTTRFGTHFGWTTTRRRRKRHDEDQIAQKDAEQIESSRVSRLELECATAQSHGALRLPLRMQVGRNAEQRPGGPGAKALAWPGFAPGPASVRQPLRNSRQLGSELPRTLEACDRAVRLAHLRENDPQG